MITQHKLAIMAFVLTLGSQAPAVKIYGGHEAVPHSRPYMVLLEKMSEGHARPSYCDGFLLNEDFVMTAAHCQGSSYTVFLGLHNVQENIEQRRFVEKSFPHKDYVGTNNTVENDIMLLKLSEKAILTNHVRPIGLPGPRDRTRPRVCLVPGWGRSNRASKFGTIKLMEVNVTLTMDGTCAEKHLYCSEGEKGPGPGDSGGPLVCEDGLVHGVVSFTMEVERQPTNQLIHAFTKIADYNDWIHETLGKHLRYNSK